MLEGNQHGRGVQAGRKVGGGSPAAVLAALINTWQESCTHEKETNKSYIEEQLLILNSYVVGLSQFAFQ